MNYKSICFFICFLLLPMPLVVAQDAEDVEEEVLAEDVEAEKEAPEELEEEPEEPAVEESEEVVEEEKPAEGEEETVASEEPEGEDAAAVAEKAAEAKAAALEEKLTGIGIIKEEGVAEKKTAVTSKVAGALGMVEGKLGLGTVGTPAITFPPGQKRLPLETLQTFKTDIMTLVKDASQKAREIEFDLPVEGKAQIKVTLSDYAQMRFMQLVQRAFWGKFEPDEGFEAYYDDAGIKLKFAILDAIAICTRGFRDLNRATKLYLAGAEGKEQYAELMKDPIDELTANNSVFDAAKKAYAANPDTETLEAFREARAERAALSKAVEDAKKGIRKEALNFKFERVPGKAEESVMDFFRREFARLLGRTKAWKKVAGALEPFIALLGISPDEFIQQVGQGGFKAGLAHLAQAPATVMSEVNEKYVEHKKIIALKAQEFDGKITEEMKKAHEEAMKVSEAAKKEIETAKAEVKEEVKKTEEEIKTEVAKAALEAKTAAVETTEAVTTEIEKEKAAAIAEAAKAEEAAKKEIETAKAEVKEEVKKTEEEIKAEAAKAALEAKTAAAETKEAVATEIEKEKAAAIAEATKAEEAVTKEKEAFAEEVQKTEQETVEAATKTLEGVESVTEEERRKAEQAAAEAALEAAMEE